MQVGLRRVRGQYELRGIDTAANLEPWAVGFGSAFQADRSAPLVVRDGDGLVLSQPAVSTITPHDDCDRRSSPPPTDANVINDPDPRFILKYFGNSYFCPNR